MILPRTENKYVKQAMTTKTSSYERSTSYHTRDLGTANDGSGINEMTLNFIDFVCWFVLI